MSFRDKEATFHEVQDRYGTEEGWTREALKHLGKELSPKYYDIALERMGSDAITKEAKRQCEALHENGVHLRDGDNLINDGLLNLHKFGLTPEEVEACNAERREHNINNTLITAQAVLGEYLYFQAVNSAGSKKIAEEMYDQVEMRRKAGESVRHTDNTVRQSGYDLSRFPLKPEQVEGRTKETVEFDENYKHQLEEKAGATFRDANARWMDKFKGGSAAPGQQSHGATRY